MSCGSSSGSGSLPLPKHSSSIRSAEVGRCESAPLGDRERASPGDDDEAATLEQLPRIWNRALSAEPAGVERPRLLSLDVGDVADPVGAFVEFLSAERASPVQGNERLW